MTTRWSQWWREVFSCGFVTGVGNPRKLKGPWLPGALITRVPAEVKIINL